MDTSETYIKMCDCEEIQVGHKWGVGDSYCYPKEGGALNTVLNSDMPTNKFSRAIWLPRQDQLQEMIGAKDVAELLNRFDYWQHDNLGVRSDFWWNKEGTKSMEQLWLAFVMKEKHNKVWDGKWSVV